MSRDDDDRIPDDDADTPRAPTRASSSGEIRAFDIRERRRVGGVFESVDSRDLRGLASRDTRRMDVVGDGDPSEEVVAELQEMRRAANRMLEAHEASREPAAKKWIKWVGEKAIALVLGAAMAGLLHAYDNVRSQLSEQHDQLIALELRLAAAEHTLAAVIVPRLAPDLLQPAARGQGAP